MNVDVEQVRMGVRFALNQLRARNGQHDFEPMTRMLARATITRNLLPGTGPVSAGGDQGRDFETHPSQLPGQVRHLGADYGIPDRAMVGFACTLQQGDLRAKIRSDVAKIVGADQPSSLTAAASDEGAAGQGGPQLTVEPVDFVVVYCEADIPVARRHAIERDIRNRFQVKAVVIDGAAITEHLMSHSTFWIAETYLHVPSQIFPPPPDRPDWYEEDLTRWRQDPAPLATPGRLLDVVGCLHYASSTTEGRDDVPFWLDRIEGCLGVQTPSTMRRRAQYEYTVANVRGLGSAIPADAAAAEYLNDTPALKDPWELQDASVLLLYLYAAFARGKTGHSARALDEWNAQLIAATEALLAADPSPTPGAACSLLETLAFLRMQPDIEASAKAGMPYIIDDDITQMSAIERLDAHDTGGLYAIEMVVHDAEGAVDALTRLIRHLPDAPLFPVTRLGRLLTMMAPSLIDLPGYDAIVAAIDERVVTASGQSTAAELAFDRHASLVKADRRVDALRHLHRARNSLFQGESTSDLVELTLKTSAAFLNLGLEMAAKQFALAAAHLADRDHPGQHSRALARAAYAEYQQGHWVGAVELARTAVLAHYLRDEQALDFDEHPWLSDTFFELITIRALATKVGDPYEDFVEQTLTLGKLGEFLTEFEERAMTGDYAPAGPTSADLDVEEGAGISPDDLHGQGLGDQSRDDARWWLALTPEEFIERAVQQIGRPPFGEAGPRRLIRFSCLGAVWSIEFPNTYEDTPVGERFAAILQILLAQIAPDDPVMLPTEVRVSLTSCAEGTEPSIDEVRDGPRSSQLEVVLPAVDELTLASASIVGQNTLGLAFATIRMASTVTDDRFGELLVDAMEGGAPTNVVFGVPYDIAWRSSVPREQFDKRPHVEEPLADPREGHTSAHSDLDMPTGPGPTYDREHAEAELRHRYDDLPGRMAATLAGLRNDERFAEVVAILRADGWLDWQILVATHNVAKNQRLQLRGADVDGADRQALIARFMEPEPPDDPVSPDLFTVEALRDAMQITVGPSAKTWWQVTPGARTVDRAAVQELLRARYGWGDNDVEHADPFESFPSPE